MYIADKKRNRNAIRSVNLIMEAYVGLMNEIPAEKITVTAIVNRAGLNRSTFYAHFDCPEDVHKLLEQKIVDELLESINDVDLKGLIKNPAPLLEIVAKRIEGRMEYAELLFDTHSTAHWLESVKEAVIEKFLNDAKNEGMEDDTTLMINIRFFVGGYIALCRDCLMKKLNISLDSLTEPLSKTISAGLSAYCGK